MNGLRLQDDYWEIIDLKKDGKNTARGEFKAAIFDFDGTVSLIREGWQQVMIPYFTEELIEATGDTDKTQAAGCVREFVDLLTGKQTIYQCIRLVEEIKSRGGEALDPLEYKKEYNERLLRKIKYRRDGLKEGRITADEMMVPGVVDFIKKLREKGVTLYLASGTDEPYVFEEARLLGIEDYFGGGIYGAREQYKLFSKAMVIQKIIETHFLSGRELVGFGDGYVEIENVRAAGGFAVGVASNEAERKGFSKWKINRLSKAGADILIPDFSESDKLIDYLFPPQE